MLSNRLFYGILLNGGSLERSWERVPGREWRSSRGIFIFLSEFV